LETREMKKKNASVLSDSQTKKKRRIRDSPKMWEMRGLVVNGVTTTGRAEGTKNETGSG